MSQITLPMGAGDGHSGTHDRSPRIEAHIAARSQLDPASVTLPRGAGRGLTMLLLLAGLASIAATVVGGMSGNEHAASHAMISYHMGFIYVLGLALGSLGITMIFQQFNAGWAAAVRRQAENVASNIWFVGLLFLPVVILEVFVFRSSPKLFEWMNPALVDPKSGSFDFLLDKKKVFLNGEFWAIRYALYFTIWTVLALRLAKLSRLQDVTGDKWLTAKARKISSYGLLLFALTAAFGSFDWLMSLDHHWFSTMFGVWFFAGSIRAAIALLIVILCVLKIRGKLAGTYTVEHMHDHGKLLLAFTVFWAYITFCQYFLIWYSNIPEETAFYNLRVAPAWQPLPQIMIIMNFVVPFLLLLIRKIKRNPRTLLAVAAFVLVAYSLDIYFIVRPMLHGVGFGENVWLDVLGILGPIFLFLAMVVRRVVSAPLVPIKDPRLHEVLAHKNYV